MIAGGCRLFIISNQAGVGKGLYTQKTLDDITAAMRLQLGKEVVFDGIFYCTHLPDANCAAVNPRPCSSIAAAEQLKEKGYED